MLSTASARHAIIPAATGGARYKSQTGTPSSPDATAWRRVLLGPLPPALDPQRAGEARGPAFAGTPHRGWWMRAAREGPHRCADSRFARRRQRPPAAAAAAAAAVAAKESAGGSHPSAQPFTQRCQLAARTPSPVPVAGHRSCGSGRGTAINGEPHQCDWVRGCHGDRPLVKDTCFCLFHSHFSLTKPPRSTRGPPGPRSSSAH